jgi:hypothetical protein
MRLIAIILLMTILLKADVLGWIWEQNKEGDETAAEYKARIETERTAKVQAQIDRKAAQSTGVMEYIFDVFNVLTAAVGL